MSLRATASPTGLAATLLFLGGSAWAGPSRAVLAASAQVERPTSAASIVFGDVDGDRLPDAVIVGEDGKTYLLRNFGEGRFEDITTASGLGGVEGATCALLSDFDGDGDLDLFLGSSETRVWRNVGAATFQPLPSGVEHDFVDFAAQAVDHDGDERVDLQIQTEAGILLYRNVDGGSFDRVELPVALVSGAASERWLASPSRSDDDAAAAAEEDSLPPNASATERRLARWRSARARSAGEPTSRGSSAPAAASGPRAGTAGPGVDIMCLPSILDVASGNCLQASSVPTLGSLYPISSDLFVDTSGRIGMGTTSPSDLLHLSSSGQAILRLEADTDNTNEMDHAGIELSQDNGQHRSYIGFNEGANELQIQSASNHIDFDTNGVNRMRVTVDGNVGVGTPTPARRLDVQENALGHSARVMNLDPAGNSSVEFSNTAGNFQSAIGYANPSVAVPWAGHSFLIANGSDFVIATNNAERMRILGGGQVGIGTTSPTEMLHIGGRTLVDGGLTVDPSSVWSDEDLRIADSDGQVALYSNTSGNSSGNFAMKQVDNAGLLVDVWEFQKTNDTTLQFKYGSSPAAGSNPTMLTLKGSSGHLGLGTTNPTADVHVASTSSTVLRLEADTNDAGESDHARIELSQDGGLESGILGFRDGQNDLKLLAAGATGDLVLGSANTERMRFEQDGRILVGPPSQQRLEARADSFGGLPSFRAARPDGTSHYYMGQINAGDLVYGCMASDASSFGRAGFYYNPVTNQGVVFGNVKNFRQPNPRDPSTDIVYASLEGPEAAAYARGRATLVHGAATIELPQHFRDVAVAEGMTVQVTPRSAASLGLAVIESTTDKIVVRELHQGEGTYDFDWEVKAVRSGYEDYQVIRPKLRVPVSK